MDFTTIDYVRIAAQIIVAITLFNVWLFRFNKSTQWRGGDASSMKEEFEVYGLPMSMLYLVGGLKVLFGIGYLVGIIYPSITTISAIGIIILMAGAIAMHIKVKDDPKKSFPAFSMLVLSLFILVLN